MENRHRRNRSAHGVDFRVACRRLPARPSTPNPKADPARAHISSRSGSDWISLDNAHGGGSRHDTFKRKAGFIQQRTILRLGPFPASRNCQHNDVETGVHIWAERYDRLLDDVFALQDDLTASVIGAIEPNLRKAEIDRVRRKRPESL